MFTLLTRSLRVSHTYSVRYLGISIRFGLVDLSKMAAAVSTSVVADLLYSAVSLTMDSLCRLNQQRRLKNARKPEQSKNALFFPCVFEIELVVSLTRRHLKTK